MKYVFLVFICFILFNCGKKKEEVADENESVNRTFDGTYSTSCFSKDSNYQKVTIIISGKDASVYWRNYKNNSCSSDSFFSEFSKHETTTYYDDVNVIKSSDNNSVVATKTSAIVNNFYFTPKTDNYTSEINNSSLCAFSNWQNNVRKDISYLVNNTGCVSHIEDSNWSAKINEETKEIFKLIESTLWLGDDRYPKDSNGFYTYIKNSNLVKE